MKKTILGIILTVALLVAMVGNVNAASVSADKTTVKAGEKVVVTVSTTKDIQNTDFSMTYNTEFFKYVGTTTTLTDDVADNDIDGEVFVSMSSASKTTKAVKLTFEALKDVKAGEATFTVNSETYNNGDVEALTGNSVTVKVEKAATEQKPADTQKPGTDNKDDGQKDDDVNFQQTGAPVYAGVIAIIVVAGAILLIRKAK